MTLLKMSRIRAQIFMTNFGIRSSLLSDLDGGRHTSILVRSVSPTSFSIVPYLLRIPAVRVRFVNCPLFTPFVQI